MIHNKNYFDIFIIRCKPNINEDRHANNALNFFFHLFLSMLEMYDPCRGLQGMNLTGEVPSSTLNELTKLKHL